MHDHRRVTVPSWPPVEVKAVTGLFLGLLDEAAPGLVEGLYLHGSLGFGEWYAGRSDIDYVAVLARRPDPATVDLLRRVHEQVAGTFPTAPYDGFHCTWADLAGSPADCPDLPCTQGGWFHDEARLDVQPVTWHELAGHGVHVRGPRLDEVGLWTDQRALRDYTRANLSEYWAPEVDQLRRFPAEAGKPDLMTWFVLGAARLHHLLATDLLTSKNGAGQHVVATFGEEWRPLVAQALSFRAAGAVSDEYDAAVAGPRVVELTDLVVEAGLALPR